MTFVIPSIVSLPSQEWVGVTVFQSTVTMPVSIQSGSSIRVTRGPILYWPGQGPPTNLFAAEHSTGPGICYLGVPGSGDAREPLIGIEEERDDSFAGAGQTWWLYHDATTAIDLNLIPLATDREFAVFAHGAPGFGWVPQQGRTTSIGPAAQVILNANPYRKYLFIQNSGGVNVTLGLGLLTDFSPTTVNGISLPLAGASFELFGSAIYRGQITALANGTGALSFVEGE